MVNINLLGGGSYDTFDPKTGEKEEQFNIDVDGGEALSWKTSYESVPFVRLAKVESAKPEVPHTATFTAGRGGELFYDAQCSCIADTEECNRTADCCTDGGVNEQAGMLA